MFDTIVNSLLSENLMESLSEMTGVDTSECGKLLRNVSFTQYVSLREAVDNDDHPAIIQLINELNSFSPQQRANPTGDPEIAQNLASMQQGQGEEQGIDLSNPKPGMKISIPKEPFTGEVVPRDGPTTAYNHDDDADGREDSFSVPLSNKKKLSIEPDDDVQDSTKVAASGDEQEAYIDQVLGGLEKVGLDIKDLEKGNTLLTQDVDMDIDEGGEHKISAPHSYGAMGRNGGTTVKQIQKRHKKRKPPGPKKGAKYKPRRKR